MKNQNNTNTNMINDSIADRNFWDELLDTPESKEMMNDMVIEAQKSESSDTIEIFI